MSRLPKLLLLAAGLVIGQGIRKGSRRTMRGGTTSSLADVLAHRARRKPPRKPPEAGMPVPAIPPGGPLPKQGGAEAPLEFD
ncbi:MAG: hypothetical protein DI637_09980 [Citromicrobium sp.]|nr:MAG: hypothetical protein DI637_09980 [Citromicrobium sp.]